LFLEQLGWLEDLTYERVYVDTDLIINNVLQQKAFRNEFNKGNERALLANHNSR
jgi:hypothetical protein